ncbi:MAG TPA: cyclic nucleotide-binding domain-containing protein [Candidatus Saccharimonadales bacterium]|nr:cyclic nucleotide-binding domain-containing protein [Candidatus Saccharimonadales bacterium]
MRIESSVTSVSWIPSEAVQGVTKVPFEMGLAHYDDPPPDHIESLTALREADRFRFANHLSAWIDVDDGRIIGHGQGGGGQIGSTTIRLGGRGMTFAAVAFPDMHPAPVTGDGWVRFAQTAGGRTGVPAPRRVNRPPFVQLAAPLAWTSLTLTIHADGTSSYELTGASPFPRHWVYGGDRHLAQKSGLVDFKRWYQHAFGKHTPWGDEDSPALVTQVETALERELSLHIMRNGVKPRVETVKEGATLVEQGDPGSDMYVLLDGVLSVEVDGAAVAQVGPGAVLGERALIEGGRRTATLRALTPSKVAAASGAEISPEMLSELAAGHRREGTPPG